MIITALAEVPWLDVKQMDHATIVGNSWHKIGSENLVGPIAGEICPAIGKAAGQMTDCPNVQSVAVEKYMNNISMPIYLASGGIGYGHSFAKVYMVIYNSQIVCMWTNSTQPSLGPFIRCPAAI
jgi:hypothetical protein